MKKVFTILLLGYGLTLLAQHSPKDSLSKNKTKVSARKTNSKKQEDNALTLSIQKLRSDAAGAKLQIAIDATKKAADSKAASDADPTNKTKAQARVIDSVNAADKASDAKAATTKITAIDSAKKSFKKDTLAFAKSQFTAATYNNVASVRDNDPSGFTQYYITLSAVFKPGIILDSSEFDSSSHTFRGYNHAMWGRNLYFQALYSPQAYKYDSVITSTPKKKLVNRLDLMQYSQFNLTTDVNVVTFVVTDKASPDHAPQDLLHFYIDALAGFLINEDSVHNKSSLSVFSAQYGLRFAAKTEKAVSKDFYFELGVQFLQIDPWSSSLTPTLNPQLRNISDTVGMSSSKPLTRAPNPLYYNLDATISTSLLSNLINIGTKPNSNSVTLFLHASVYSNFLNASSKYDNTFYQIQIGTAINLNAPSKNNTNSASSNTGTPL